METSAQDEYYTDITKSLIKANIGSDGKICNEKIEQAVFYLRSELDLEHKHNINNITCEYVYTSPMKKNEGKEIDDLVYHESDEQADTISDSSKQVYASNEPTTDTHIVGRVCNLSVGIVSVKPAVIGVGIIGQGTTQGVISGRTNIVDNIVTDILTDSSKQLFEINKFQLNSLQSGTLVLGPQDKSVKSTKRIIIMPSDSRNIRGNHTSRIDTPVVNKDVWGVIDTTSNVLSCTDNVKKFDSIVQSSTTQERNLESSCIEEEGLKSIFPKLGTKLYSIVQVNLANAVLRESPKFKHRET